jgi:hypothetical protein
VFIGNKALTSCPKASGSLAGLNVGPLAIGMPLTKAETVLRKTGQTANGMPVFCLYAGFGIRAAIPTHKLLREPPAVQRKHATGRLVLLLTANPYYNLGGVVPGDTIATAASDLHLSKPFVVGANTWYFAPGAGANGIIKVRYGVVYEIGLASKPLTKTAKAEHAFITSFG